jgi:hypothetical protein
MIRLLNQIPAMRHCYRSPVFSFWGVGRGQIWWEIRKNTILARCTRSFVRPPVICQVHHQYIPVTNCRTRMGGIGQLLFANKLGRQITPNWFSNSQFWSDWNAVWPIKDKHIQRAWKRDHRLRVSRRASHSFSTKPISVGASCCPEHCTEKSSKLWSNAEIPGGIWEWSRRPQYA